mmetsp:Transcript_114031/g.322837  ORF Transcript_114031/g.322837 Transcript_114031/m.322837 type:complete len:346 (-) Transcript_114031:746-1783(-)
MLNTASSPLSPRLTSSFGVIVSIESLPSRFSLHFPARAAGVPELVKNALGGRLERILLLALVGAVALAGVVVERLVAIILGALARVRRRHSVWDPPLQHALEDLQARRVGVRVVVPHEAALHGVARAQGEHGPRQLTAGSFGCHYSLVLVVHPHQLHALLQGLGHLTESVRLQLQRLVERFRAVLGEPPDRAEGLAHLRERYQGADDLHLPGDLQAGEDQPGRVAEAGPLVEDHRLQYLRVAGRRLHGDRLLPVQRVDDGGLAHVRLAHAPEHDLRRHRRALAGLALARRRLLDGAVARLQERLLAEAYGGEALGPQALLREAHDLGDARQASLEGICPTTNMLR